MYYADDDFNQLKIFLIKSIDTRFKDIETNNLYSVATFVDPRYKDRFFSGITTFCQVQEEIRNMFNLDPLHQANEVIDEDNLNKN